MELLDRWVERARRLSTYGAWFGGILILIASIIVGVEVVIRKAFNITTGGADELSGFALAISSAFAFSFALFERSHVRIDSVYTALPTRVCAVLDIIGLSIFSMFMTFLAYMSYGVFNESLSMGSKTMTSLATPLMIPQFFWVVGLFFFVAVAGLLLTRAIVTLFTGNFLAVQLQIGSKTVREELNEELDQLEKLAEQETGTPGQESSGGAS
jgi:TRAP-type mannitol/chloroaromatic compound transport system permease small subunit